MKNISELGGDGVQVLAAWTQFDIDDILVRYDIKLEGDEKDELLEELPCSNEFREAINKFEDALHYAVISTIDKKLGRHENLKDEYAEFLEDYKEEIEGFYQSTFYKNGGWNGLMDSIAAVEEKYNISDPSVSNIFFEWQDGEFEELIYSIFEV